MAVFQPSFVASAGTGDRIHAIWGEQWYAAMLDAAVPNIEMHLYGSGSHGGGLKDRDGLPFGKWQDRLVEWMTDTGFLGTEKGEETKAARDVRQFASEPDARREPPGQPPAGDSLGLSSQEKDSAGGNFGTGVAEASGLPRVLLLGDSISLGYHDDVVSLLSGKAEVSRPRANCADTVNGLQHLAEWLGDGAFDIIHFNFGLHDLCYRHPDAEAYGKRDKEKGQQSVPLERTAAGSWWHGDHASGASYTDNLEAIVAQLAATGAKLIWANTTVVPEGEAGRVVGDELRYNAAAADVMVRHGVPTDDLYTLSASFGPVSKTVWAHLGTPH